MSSQIMTERRTAGEGEERRNGRCGPQCGGRREGGTTRASRQLTYLSRSLLTSLLLASDASVLSSPIPHFSPILIRNSFSACLLPTPRPPPVCVSLSRSAFDGVLLGLLFTPCQQLHIMHKWNGYSCIRYPPLSLMPILSHFSTSSICHASISSFHPTPRRFRPRRSEKLSSSSNIESGRNSQTIIQWISSACRARSGHGRAVDGGLHRRSC